MKTCLKRRLNFETKTYKSKKRLEIWDPTDNAQRKRDCCLDTKKTKQSKTLEARLCKFREVEQFRRTVMRKFPTLGHGNFAAKVTSRQ